MSVSPIRTSMMKRAAIKLEVALLKSEAKKIFLQRDRLFDRYHMCGRHMIEVATGGTLQRLEDEFNAIMDKLRDLGEPVPSGRLGEQTKVPSKNQQSR